MCTIHIPSVVHFSKSSTGGVWILNGAAQLGLPQSLHLKLLLQLLYYQKISCLWQVEVNVCIPFFKVLQPPSLQQGHVVDDINLFSKLTLFLTLHC